tara:strand:- start:1262 stop:1852 length:591 start_codon:yes stop_codon:yes gene_type:complete
MPGSIKLSDGSNTIAITAPGSISSDKTLTLPNETGTLALSTLEVDQWHLTSDRANDNSVITANLSRFTTGIAAGYAGTGMTQSSGIFSFPSTGIWSVRAMITMQSHENDSQGVYIIGTDDNFSSETVLSNIHVAHRATSTGAEVRNGYGEVVVDITDTSNRKIKFQVFGQNDGDDVLNGSSSRMVTGFTFQRLGNT